MKVKSILINRRNDHTVGIKEGNHSISYADWYRLSCSIASKIISILTKDSITVALFLENSINYATSYFAILFSDKIVIPLSPQLKTPEIITNVRYCEVDLIITDSRHFDYLVQVFAKYEHRISVLNVNTMETTVCNEENICVLKHHDENERIMKCGVAIMLHTSGTTSNPKRVMLTNDNIIENIKSNVLSLNLDSRDRVLITLPMYFGYCNTAQFLTHLYLGSQIILYKPVFLPKLFFKIVEKEQITCFTTVPTELLSLLHFQNQQNFNFSSLRYICFGGGYMPVDKLRLLIEKYPSIGFVQTYGQTECSPRVTALLPEYSVSKIGSVGKPIPGVRVQVVDEEGKGKRIGQIGEIVVRGRNTMLGYYKQKEETERVIRGNWIRTGDLGYFDNEGFLYLTGRISNVIISGGINIYPEEIEQSLLKCPGVKDIVVFGKQHDLLGEVPVANVVLDSSGSLKVLEEYCVKNLANYKIPTYFEIVNQISKTYNGKVERRRIKPNTSGLGELI